jgi:hypothetical protein
LKNGSYVKISKDLKFSELPKIKKISLSTMGIFHISSASPFFCYQKIQLEVVYNFTDLDFPKNPMFLHGFSGGLYGMIPLSKWDCFGQMIFEG